MEAGSVVFFQGNTLAAAHFNEGEKEEQAAVINEEIELNEEEEEALANFYCPVYKTVMENPTRIVTCGHIFERCVLENWIKDKNQRNCPLCRGEATWSEVQEDFNLKEIIAQWREKNKEIQAKIIHYLKMQKDLQNANELLQAQNRQLFNELNHYENTNGSKKQQSVSRTTILSLEQVQMTLNSILPEFINSDEERRHELVKEVDNAIYFARPFHLLQYFREMLFQSELSIENLALIWDQVCPYVKPETIKQLDQTLIDLMHEVKSKKNEETIKWLNTLVAKGEAEIVELKLQANQAGSNIEALRLAIAEKEAILNNYKTAIKIASGIIIFAAASKGAQFTYLYIINKNGN